MKTFNESAEQLKKMKHGRQLVHKLIEAQHGSKKKGKGRGGDISSSSSMTSLTSKSNKSVSQASSNH